MAASLVGIREELSTALWKIMQGERVEGDEKQVTNTVSIQAISMPYLTMQLSHSVGKSIRENRKNEEVHQTPR